MRSFAQKTLLEAQTLIKELEMREARADAVFLEPQLAGHAPSQSTSGWAAGAVKVIAIEPELENWLWQDKPQVADALRYKGDKSLRQHLTESGWWPAGAAKPPRPKEAAEWLLRQTRQPRSSAIYQKLAEHVSVKGCTDTAFAEMRAAFLAWFPLEAAA